MADLVVHFATAYLPGQAIRDGRARAILYLGVCLPDLLHHGLQYLLGAPSGFALPSHSPLALVAWCYLGALLFEEEWRRRAFGALLAGSWLHVLVDLGQDTLGEGRVLWGFPFTLSRVELGWYRPEDTVCLTLPALVLFVLVELGGRVRRRKPVTSRGGPDSSRGAR